MLKIFRDFFKRSYKGYSKINGVVILKKERLRNSFLKQISPSGRNDKSLLTDTVVQFTYVNCTTVSVDYINIYLLLFFDCIIKYNACFLMQ